MLRVLQIKLGGSLLVSLEECRGFVAQSPTFSHIFLARLLLFSHAELKCFWPTPYQLRLLLGVSWDNVRMALSAARSMIDRISREQVVARTITILALVLELYPANLSSLISALACGYLHLIQRNGPVHTALYSELNVSMPHNTHGHWGTLIRCCPPSSPELLSQLHKFVPLWECFNSDVYYHVLCPEYFYNVLQWLKVFPSR
ncbi:hypothetical protein B0H13DRAFT_1924162 [Mycena leptocephala]|nr:hypothetical protein B0H13DRAFT_1924162 [Mycena leptocephala]